MVYVHDNNGEKRDFFIGMFQTPKVPERYAWRWAIKMAREWLKKHNIPFDKWANYHLYPVSGFNCCQFNWPKEEMAFDHIHIADYPKEEDEETLRFYNSERGSRHSCKIK